jgi:hypothetical protein
MINSSAFGDVITLLEDPDWLGSDDIADYGMYNSLGRQGCLDDDDECLLSANVSESVDSHLSRFHRICGRSSLREVW